jgi:hypothetical protein
MFPLATTLFPSSAAELARLLNEGLRRIFETESDPVTVRDRSYPHLEAVIVSLDGARLRGHPPDPLVSVGETSPALEIDQLALAASPLFLGPVAIRLSLSARGVQLGQGKDSTGQIVLSLKNAATGKIEMAATQTDLAALISNLAQTYAKKQGITIDDVQLKLRQQGSHSLAVEVRLRARKLFLSASIQVTGQLELDDQLNLRISALKCTGDGGIATLACGVLKPYLEKMEGREFPLMSLPLGEIRLREIHLAVGEELSVTAEFGSAS